jgi:hypothetical protein
MSNVQAIADGDPAIKYQPKPITSALPSVPY